MVHFSTADELPKGSATVQIVSHLASHCCSLVLIAGQVMGFVMDKKALGQVSSESSYFPWKFLFHQLLHIH
jgi:hypothetical protein